MPRYRATNRRAFFKSVNFSILFAAVFVNFGSSAVVVAASDTFGSTEATGSSAEAGPGLLATCTVDQVAVRPTLLTDQPRCFPNGIVSRDRLHVLSCVPTANFMQVTHSELLLRTYYVYIDLVSLMERSVNQVKKKVKVYRVKARERNKMRRGTLHPTETTLKH